MENKQREIPQISSSRFSVDQNEKLITLDFFDIDDIEHEELDSEKIIAQLTLPYDSFFDFAVSFLTTGIQAENELDIDLGFKKRIENKIY